MIQLTVLKDLFVFLKTILKIYLGKGIFFSIKVIFPWQVVANIMISNISVELMQYKFKSYYSFT